MPSGAEVISDPREMHAWVRERQKKGRRVGVVPTMGALHEGHLSLIDAGAAACDDLVTTIFVNPTQFAAGEDLEKYPRPFERDVALAGERGAAAVFAPATEVMYPPGSQTVVEVIELTRRWEGEKRPTHFRGVTTIVAKLLNIIPAEEAYFGQKDYQQLLVVRQMAEDLNVPTRIVMGPIVREEDGLAMSSRNVYLSPAARSRAVALFRALEAARAAVERGTTRAPILEQEMQAILQAVTPDEIDYAVVVDAQTLEPLQAIDRPAVALLAVRFDQTRLIDNMLLN